MGLSLALVSSIQRKKKYSKGMMRRGRRRRQRGEDLVAPEIPLDLQIEILSRLPGNSLMRFKCLSKLWSSLICSRNFSNGYLTVASPRRPPRLYISLVDHPKCGSMEACDDPRKSVLLSLSSSSSDSGKSFDQDLTMPGMGGHNMVVLRGLILYIVCGKACICNPTTRQSVTLPALKSNIFVQKDLEKSVLYFLGHDPVLDQYKVVCTAVSSSTDLDTIISEHWVFVLEVGGSWKRVEFDQLHTPTRPGLCIRGVIYYLAFTSSMSTDIIVSFDVRSEELNIIQAPLTLSAFFGSVGFIEYGGKPAIIDHTSLVPMGLVDLWVLEDAGNWSKKSLCLQPSQMHLVSNNIDLTVEGTTQNGEVILAPCELRSPFYILYYDLEKNDLSKVQVRGIPDNGFSSSYFCFKLMDNSESIIHLKT